MQRSSPDCSADVTNVIRVVGEVVAMSENEWVVDVAACVVLGVLVGVVVEEPGAVTHVCFVGLPWLESGVGGSFDFFSISDNVSEIEAKVGVALEATLLSTGVVIVVPK